MKAIASRLEGVAIRLEAIAFRLEAIAGKLEAKATVIGLEAIADRPPLLDCAIWMGGIAIGLDSKWFQTECVV